MEARVAQPPLAASLTKYRPDPMRLALAALIFVGISRIHNYYSFIGVLRPALMLFVLVFAYAFLVPSSVDWKLLKASWLPKALTVFAIIACLSAPFGLSLGQSGTYILNSYSRVLVPALIYLIAIRSVNDLRLLVSAFIAAIGFQVWLSMFVMDVTVTMGGLARVNTAGMYDGNDLGMIFAMALPMALVLVQSSSNTLVKLANVGVIWGIGFTIALTGSRGAMVGLVAIGFGMMVFVRHVAVGKKLFVIGLVAASLVVAAPEGYWTQMQTILNPEEDYNMTDPHGRKALAIRGLGYMMQYPLFGVGVDNFGRAEMEISPLLREGGGQVAIRDLVAHNTYIQVGAEMGVVALGIWLAILWMGIIGVQKLRNQVPSSWRHEKGDRAFLYAMLTYLPIAFIGFAATSMFVTHAYTPPFYIFLGYLAALFHLVPAALRESGAETPVLHHGAGRGRGRGQPVPAPAGAGRAGSRPGNGRAPARAQRPRQQPRRQPANAKRGKPPAQRRPAPTPRRGAPVPMPSLDGPPPEPVGTHTGSPRPTLEGAPPVEPPPRPSLDGAPPAEPTKKPRPKLGG